MPADLALDALVDMLDRHQQRATYGAVAGYLGRPAAFLMNGIQRAPKYSWVVNQETLQPTGYEKSEIHPALERTKFVLLTEAELRKWLTKRAPSGSSAPAD